MAPAHTAHLCVDNHEWEESCHVLHGVGDGYLSPAPSALHALHDFLQTFANSKALDE